MHFLLVAFGICAVVMLAGMLYQRAGAANDARRFPPLGELFEVNHRRLHIHCKGAGSPTVVFESGMASTSLGWSLVQPAIAQITRTASYDRFGLGWSDPVASPRDLEQVVSDLHNLLELAGIRGPLVFVAHSYGGLVVRGYAARYPEEVAGLVLVDPVAAVEWSVLDASHRKLLQRGILVSRFCGVLTRLGIVRLLMNYWNAVARILPRHEKQKPGGSHGVAGLDRIVGEVKKLPRELWPMVGAHWCQPKCFDGMGLYLKALPASAVEVERAESGEVRDIPLIVLSAGNASAGQRAEHEDLARRSPRGRMEIVPASGHWIHFDAPEVVIRAVQDMLAACRTESGAADLSRH